MRLFRTFPAGTHAQIFRLSLYSLLTVILALGDGIAYSADKDTVSDDKTAKLELLRKQIHALRESLDTARNKKGSLQQQLRSSEVEIGELNLSLKSLDERLKIQARELDKLHAQKIQQRENLKEQQQSLADQIRASYAMGKQGYMKILLNQQDPAEIGRTLTYYDYFNRARTTRIHTIDSTIKELDRLEVAIAEETSRLKTMHNEQGLKMQALEESRQSRHNIIVKLDAEIVDNEQRLKQLLQDEEVLVKLLEGIRDALTNIPPDRGNIPPFATLKGSLSWPSGGRISTRYGASRNIGQLKWQGITISAPEGAEVKAIYHGRVAFADWLRGYGLLLILDHGNGYMSLYGYNQSLYKTVGEWVEAGETIAAIGNSGGRLASGLYFEIRHNGAPVNPVAWCKAGKT